jgi:hypothetical protein
MGVDEKRTFFVSKWVPKNLCSKVPSV